MSEVESNSAAAAAVLSDVEHLRDEARTARHAYWFPLMVFGILVTASAPLYVSPTIITESGSYGIEGQPNLGWLQQSFVGAPSPGLTALYWLGAILGGTVLGITESIAAGFISSAYKDVIAFMVMIVVLLFRPEGLLGKR